MPTGKIKFYDAKKGYGFIAPDDGGADVFVHATALELSNVAKLIAGQALEYDLGPDQKTGRSKVIRVRV